MGPTSPSFDFRPLTALPATKQLPPAVMMAAANLDRVVVYTARAVCRDPAARLGAVSYATIVHLLLLAAVVL